MCILLAMVATRPLVGHISGCVALGADTSGTVPLFNMWTLWWNADRITYAYKGYWNAPIFHPAQKAFALSEPQPLLGAIALPLWFILPSPTYVYNCVLIGTIAANGLCAYIFLLRGRIQVTCAIIGGALMVLLPITYLDLGTLQLMSLWGIILVLWALQRFGEQPGMRRAVVLAMSFAGCYLMCSYFGLFLGVILLACGGALLGHNALRVATWKWLFIAGVIAAAILSPVIWAQKTVLCDNDYRFSQDAVAELSAHPSQYLVKATNDVGDAWGLSPGAGRYGLAIVGMLYGWRVRAGARRMVVFCSMMAVIAAVLSWGPHGDLATTLVHRTLVSIIPGLNRVRSWYRFAFFVQMAITLLAAVGLDGVRGWAVSLGKAACRSWERVNPGSGVWIVVAAFLVLEGFPPEQRLYRTPGWSEEPKWVEWLAGNTKADDVIACIPLLEDDGDDPYEQAATWMFWQMRHRRPMVNGYSGHLPDEYIDVEEAVRDDTVTEEQVRVLRQCGVKWCVIDTGRCKPARDLRGLRLRFIEGERAGMAVCEVLGER